MGIEIIVEKTIFHTSVFTHEYAWAYTSMLFISLKRRQRSQNDSAILESNLIHQTRRQEYHTQANRHITIYWEKIKAYHLVSAHYSLRNQLYALVTLISKCSKYAAVIAESDEEWNLMGYAAETNVCVAFVDILTEWTVKAVCSFSKSVNGSPNAAAIYL